MQRGILVVEKPLMGHAQQTIDIETEAHKLQNEDWRIEVFLEGEAELVVKGVRMFPRTCSGDRTAGRMVDTIIWRNSFLVDRDVALCALARLN